MPWHDESPRERTLRRKKAAKTPRITEIIHQCRAGETRLKGAIVAAYSAGLDDRAAIQVDSTAADRNEVTT